jgi:hypothetical protein
VAETSCHNETALRKVVNWVADILELKVLSFKTTVASDTSRTIFAFAGPVTTTELFKNVFQIQAYYMVWTYFITEIDLTPG